MSDFAVYMIQNTENKKVYVGSSRKIRSRRTKHFSALNKNCHENYKLQLDYNEYGKDYFRWVILEYVDSNDLNTLEKREQYWIDTLKPKYNIRPTAINSYWEYKTKESRDAASDRCRKQSLGRKQSQEEKDKRAESIREFWATHPAKTIPQEIRNHLSKINTGKKNPNWGLKRTPDQLKNMSEGRANIIYTFKSPDGELFSVKNLSKCDLLSYGAMRNLYRGKTKEYKGWTFVGSEKVKR